MSIYICLWEPLFLQSMCAPSHVDTFAANIHPITPTQASQIPIDTTENREEKWHESKLWLMQCTIGSIKYESC